MKRGKAYFQMEKDLELHNQQKEGTIDFSMSEK